MANNPHIKLDAPKPAAPHKQAPLALLTAMALLCLHGAPLLAADAEIVSLCGKGESRARAADDWKPAQMRQTLNGGAFVRTGDASQMALILGDQTQLRLNQNSLVQIKEMATKTEPTKLELVKGRVWTQAKQRAPDAARTAAAEPAVTVITPNAVAAIRGTDWELSVENDVTTLTVLSGEVEFYNDLGRVSVKKNEQARVEPGKAPSKILLTNARERVQWVTAYRADPRRWLHAIPADLQATLQAVDEQRFGEAIQTLEARKDANTAPMLADLYLSQGWVSQAIALLEANRSQPRAAALLARAYLISDRAADAGKVLAQAPQDDVEVQLARAELAHFDGQAPAMRRALESALALAENNADTWYGLGRLDTEREAVNPARTELARASSLNARGAGYQGELGTLETFANEFKLAEGAFAKALEQQPDDYVAWTGLGILQLKQGKPEDALQSLLKAGLLEPRYARASLYTGVAYYQLGRTYRAREMFQRSIEQDATDPLPHMLLSLVAADELDFGAATASARQAAALMPYLKSLNQLLNDQKGNANVGAALAGFGLEEWAEAIAHDAYTPYWAGSSLFLSDRYSGTFNKNTQLFNGFLSDPTVFGASNRYNSLIASPGHYRTVSTRFTQQELRENEVSAVLNGYSVETRPFAYYVNADYADLRPTSELDMTARNKNATLGLGFKPSYALSLFGFATHTDIDAILTSPDIGFIGNRLNQNDERGDIGGSYRFSPTSQLWLKVGAGREKIGASGVFYSPEIADFFSKTFFAKVSPTGKIVEYAAQTRQNDVQLRQTFDLAQHRLSLGLENSRQDKKLDSTVDFAPIRNSLTQTTRYEATDAYVADQIHMNAQWLLDGSLTYTDFEKRYEAQKFLKPGVFNTVQLPTDRDNRNDKRWNARLGFVWTPARGNALRVAAQQWQRPASVNTLAPIETAGIPVDDRLVSSGGRLQRARVQYEWTATADTFMQVFADGKRIENPLNPATNTIADLDLQDLERLRNRNRLNVQAIDLLEDTPTFASGRVSLGGIAVNHIYSPTVSLAARYQYQQSRNTGSDNNGKRLAWLPKQILMLEGNWLPAAHWQFGASAIYRSQRYTDEANEAKLDGGWGLGLRGYWESSDKRLSVEAIAQNLYSNKDAAAVRPARYGLQLAYRF